MKKHVRRIVCMLVMMLGLILGGSAGAEVQKAMFPVSGKLNITQAGAGFVGEYGGSPSSHNCATNYAIDLGGAVKVYAPFDVVVKYNEPGVTCYTVFQSADPVLLRDGSTSYVQLLMMHDDDTSDLPAYNVRIPKGTHIYTGGKNVGGGGVATGPHLHMEIALGSWRGWNVEMYYGSLIKPVTIAGVSLTTTLGIRNAIDPTKYFFLNEGTSFSKGGFSDTATFQIDKWNNAWSIERVPFSTTWANVSANDKSNGLNKVTDTNTDAFLCGEVQYAMGTLLNGAGCFLSANRPDVANATPSNAGKALHVADPTSSFATAGNGYQDASGYRYTKVYYTAQASGNYGFGTKLTPGTKYYYRFYSLRTVNGAQEITYSDIKEFTTTGTAPAAKYALTISANTGGTVNTTASGSYESGKTITLTATPSTGYKFTCWTSSNGGTFANAGSATTTFTMPAANTTVTANFRKQYYLTTSAGNGGTVSSANGYYDNGQTITLTATPSTGYKFTGWTSSNGGSFANAGNATTTFTMPAANTTVTAVFAEVPSEWSATQPAGWPIVTTTQYRQRIKSTTTSTSSTLAGWTHYNTTVGEWGAWSAWSTTPVTASTDVQVETQTIPAVTKTVHKYSHYRAYLDGLGWRTAPAAYSGWNGTWYHITLDYALNQIGTYDGYPGYGYYNNYVWFNHTTEQQTVTAAYTQYRYRTRGRTYHFYRWSDWSAWQLNALNANATTEVEIRSAYKLWSGIDILRLPDSLTTIREQAFAGAAQLDHLEIPTKVTAIGSQAFANCTDLRSVYLPASLVSVADDAFEGCQQLTLYVEQGSVAERFAAASGLPYYCVK